MSLTACTTTPVKFVAAPVTPIPANLTANCIPPLPGQPLTYGGAVTYSDQLLDVIDNCNRDKAAIRKIEAERQK
ncbi:Rz1-like lysis system protein LysC [Serratia quinivorans]|uniref:Rz1-like lysis system protein LysC n=1 Tax=Serratia quinivorans TaxID=137545 RepID=UPI003F9E7A44